MFTIVVDIYEYVWYAWKLLYIIIFFFQEWPINGGNWGLGAQSYPEIIITG